MSDIATELTRLQTAKANIKTSIENKGVTVPSATTIDGYPSLIDQISTGVQEAEENDVNFYDYDGFRVASFTIAEAKALTQAEYDAILPPTHEGLTFQEWNWTLNDITTYNRRYIDIGANYITTDGKTHVKIHVDKDGDEFVLKTYILGGYNITINWGDGNIETISTATNTHSYSNAGKYEITIENNIGTNNAVWEYGNEINDNYIRSMIDEIRFDAKAKIQSYGLRYTSAKVSVPNTSMPSLYASEFQYANIPAIAIPRGCSGFTSSNIFAFFYGRVCLPKTMASTALIQIFLCSAFNRVVVPEDTNNSFNNVFIQGNTQVEVISIPSSFGISASSSANIFNYSYKLRCLDIVQGWIPSPGTSLTFSGSSFWSPDAMVDFFTKLGTTTNAITLTFGQTNLDKLTADQKAIATNKGYTLA